MPSYVTQGLSIDETLQFQKLTKSGHRVSRPHDLNFTGYTDVSEETSRKIKDWAASIGCSIEKTVHNGLTHRCIKGYERNRI